MVESTSAALHGAEARSINRVGRAVWSGVRPAGDVIAVRLDAAVASRRSSFIARSVPAGEETDEPGPLLRRPTRCAGTAATVQADQRLRPLVI